MRPATKKELPKNLQHKKLHETSSLMPSEFGTLTAFNMTEGPTASSVHGDPLGTSPGGTTNGPIATSGLQERDLQENNLFDVLDQLNVTRVPEYTHGATVNLVWTAATLLSGDFEDCQNAADETCEAGMAAVNAYVRYYGGDITIVPRLDYQSAFVQMHPLTWNVNRLVFEDVLGLSRWFVSPWLFDETKQDLSKLRTKNIRPLISNMIPLSTVNVWHSYIDTVYFDEKTNLAIMAVDQSGQPGAAADSVLALSGLLEHVAEENKVNGCNGTLTSYEAYKLDVFGTYDASDKNGRCWVPVIVYEDRTGFTRLTEFVNRLMNQPYPPAVIIDVHGNNEEWKEPTLLPSGVWVVSYQLSEEDYFQQKITVANENPAIVTKVELIENSLLNLPEFVKDDQYAADIRYMRKLADQAAENDPVLGKTGFMPFIRTDDEYEWRMCMGGECPGGNLFADSMRWFTDADIAFLSSGGIRGPGWEAGDVKVSDIWNMLPFPNTVCKGVMSGISLFRILDYSTREATFQSTYTPLGDRLLQVSGIRYRYNTELPATENASRIVKIEIWDKESQRYRDIERLKLYSFGTDSWLCSGFDPFPEFLTSALVRGEKAGVIGSDLHQQIVGLYLQNRTEEGLGAYDTSIQGRLVNDTDATTPLNFFQRKGACEAGTHWVEDLLTCVECPDTSGVIFSQGRLEFEGESGSVQRYPSRNELINGENLTITIDLKSKPSWIEFSQTTRSRRMGPGDVETWMFAASAEKLESGTASASVSFAVQLSGENYPTCVGRDASFEVFMRVSPKPSLAKPGSIRASGLVLMGLAIFTAIFFAVWVLVHREKRIVKAMQPQFLTTVCFGMLVIATSIVPLSLEDDIRTQAGRDIACMASPWLLSLGFSIAILSLYAKLWRINQVFNGQHFRRVTVTSKEVSITCVVMATINIILLLVWTFVDPLRYEKRSVENEPWNQYGTCSSKGAAGTALLILTLLFNAAALVIACYQAYKARAISDEYSESKNLGIALFGWVEILLVGLPVLYLIEHDNSNAKYFLQVVLIVAICLSMLLIIFVPILLHFRAHQRRTIRSHGPNVKVSGLSHAPSGSSVSHSFNIGGNNGSFDASLKPSSLSNSSGTSQHEAADDRPERHRSEEFTKPFGSLGVVDEEDHSGNNSV